MKKKRLLILLGIVLLLSAGCQKETADYDQKLFDTTYIHEIDVTLSQEDFKDLLENPTNKTKYNADVSIDGETVKNVTFSTKGNSSLMFVAAQEGNDRYPFRINFGKNIKGQTYNGLDKLSLNNLFEDSSLIKDYVSYDVFRKAGFHRRWSPTRY